MHQHVYILVILGVTVFQARHVRAFCILRAWKMRPLPSTVPLGDNVKRLNLNSERR